MMNNLLRSTFMGLGLLMGMESHAQVAQRKPVVAQPEARSGLSEFVAQAQRDQKAAIETIKRLQASNAASAPCQSELAQLEYQYADWFVKNAAEIQKKLDEKSDLVKKLEAHLQARVPQLEKFEAEVLVDPKQASVLGQATLNLNWGKDRSEVRISLKDVLQMISLFNERVTSCSKDPTVQAALLNSIRERMNDPFSNPAGLTFSQVELAIEMMAQELTKGIQDQGISYVIVYHPAQPNRESECLGRLELVQELKVANQPDTKISYGLQWDAVKQKLSVTHTGVSGMSLLNQDAVIVENRSVDGYERWSDWILQLSENCREVLSYEKLFPSILDARSGQLHVPYVSLSTLVDPKKSLKLMPSLDSFRTTPLIAKALGESVVVPLKEGGVSVWGANNYHQLGLADTQNRQVPTVVPTLKGLPIQSLVSSWGHHLALLRDGRVMAWGYNGYGALGVGDQQNRTSPTEIPGLEGLPVRSLVVGSNFSLALLKDHRVMAWGNNDSGQLGVGDREARYFPVEVVALRGRPIQALVAGQAHVVAVMQDGNVLVWGENENAQLGLGGNEDRLVPTELAALKSFRVKDLSAGYNHVLIKLADGRLMAWGVNYYGQLGLGDTLQRSQPTEVPLPQRFGVRSLQAIGDRNIIQLGDGRILAWGQNTVGQLGVGNRLNQTIPTEVKSIPNGSVKQILAGPQFTIFVQRDGQILGCGQSRSGELGMITQDLSMDPRPISLDLKQAKF